MRLSLLSFLLLTAATGAAAQSAGDEPGTRAEAPTAPRAEPRSRPARMERPERQGGDVDRGARARLDTREVNMVAQAPRPERPDRGERFEARRIARDPSGSGSSIPTPVTVHRQPRDVSPGSVAAGNLRDRIAAEGLRRDRLERDNWRRDWRQDRRYDWRRHRDRDGARFHLGIYIDPFGWRYRDYEIGWRLPSRYYQARYWLNDPYSYSLPPVGGSYRWIRYYRDVLLVDLRTGRVLDRIPYFFW